MQEGYQRKQWGITRVGEQGGGNTKQREKVNIDVVARVASILRGDLELDGLQSCPNLMQGAGVGGP